ncbi:MAG: tRNA (N(6)-L-threonylcarbamoyladenosine(37)-C(2))-methylthiotransferase MtaB [Bdellovibrionales bacterium GWB1_55_8]|nr:MAG: tRNA (N(6)-L-threonylcarbamoyladenosine(37)-C(2))-methylthiotransferase MtaB [Bdellovibrionales bacterium GWB1_55_8]
MRYVIRTLGCKANLADSQRIEAELQARGFMPWNSTAVRPADVCVINSCTVTDEADRQTRRLAARLGRDHPGTAVVVTGCAAEVDPERLAHSKGIRYIVGNRDKPQLVDLIMKEISGREFSAPDQDSDGRVLGIAQGYAEMLSRHPMDREWPAANDALGAPVPDLQGSSSKTRVFLKIQEGCNSFCTYCVIPYGRGPSRSLEPERIVEWVHSIVASGIREIVLTGTNIGDYGTDWAGEPMLEKLLERVLGETGIERLRVSSLDPTEITPGIVNLMCRDARLCPHFHVSLQSASDRVLRLMKRRYGMAEVLDCFERMARVPAGVGGVFVGMDVIAGFPGETALEFENGLKRFQELPWTRLHVFPYSERAGTPATRLPDTVPVPVRHQRTRQLNELSFNRLSQWNDQILEKSRQGALLQGVLLEKSGFHPDPSKIWFAGYTPNYVRVAVGVDAAAPKGPGVARQHAIVSVRAYDVCQDSAGGGDIILISEVVA